MNPAVDTSSAQKTQDSVFNLAVAATNAATAMELSGFTAAEARAFAANYLTYRWNDFSADVGAFLADEAPPPALGAFYLPSGPSFVDTAGVCVRSGATARGNFPSGSPGTNDLRGSGTLYLGYAPQPFINQVAAMMQADPASNALTISNAAVELYNPYPVALSLRGFKLQANSSEVDLSGYYVPARGFFTVVAHRGDALAAGVQGEHVFWDAGARNGALSLSMVGGAVVLTRPYCSRGNVNGPVDDGEVDEYSYGALMGAGLDSSGPHLYYLRRSNAPFASGSLDYWQGAIAGAGATVRVDGAVSPPVWGRENPTAAGAVGLDLSDRYTGALADSALPAVKPGDPLRNFADFNGILRVCNRIDTSGSGTNLPVSAQLATLLANAPGGASALDRDGLVHFDFMAAAGMFPTVNPPVRAAIAVTPGVQLFDYITLLDRCYDTSINVGNGAATTAKLRLPGRINVNTASRDVLLGIPALAAQPAVADSIIAYRDRRPPLFNNAATYPGRGIRTLSEMLVPVTMAVFSPGGATPQTLAQRDAVWASLLTLCTTRSDTFVVYAYLEAVKQNPAWTGTFDNGLVWYGTGKGAVTDDVHDAGAPLLRVGRRRWVAIVDRSFCNSGRGSGGVAVLPLVVAMKDLPR
jgi:hypothetical protein